MKIHFQDLQKITGGKVLKESDGSRTIDYLLTDSRKLNPSSGALFFAINGLRHNGHDFIPALIEAGIKQFVVDQKIDIDSFADINILEVDNTLTALQQLVSHKRKALKKPVVAITGSNGKTIVKEWLSQLLSVNKIVLKSPGSYNSQVGVPLSVWALAPNHDIGIFEAGISRSGEMEKLEGIIQPTIGIFTNIGSAHDEGFDSKEDKVAEKARLFDNCEQVIYCKDHSSIDELLSDKGFTWGKHPESDLIITNIARGANHTLVSINLMSQELRFKLPFTNQAYVENAMHCIAFMLLQQYSQKDIQTGLDKLRAVKMRLELKRGINTCQVIDDTYNSDLGGLQVALDFLASQKQRSKKTIIISDLLQTGLEKEALYDTIYSKLAVAGLDKIIAIGPEISEHLKDKPKVVSYLSTASFLKSHDLSSFNDELILVKGARHFGLEKIVKRLEEKIHGTHLEINLDALTHNLNFYRSKLKPGTKLMVMVKAFAYGSGILEVANLLQHHRADYLGVAYADEGVTLRRNGINIPIMVMNPTEESFEKLQVHNLEPEIYNPGILKKYIEFLNGKSDAIHLKLDTGMHRLGFKEDESDELIKLLQDNTNITVKSIFSHLAGADEDTHNEYSYEQAAIFKRFSDTIMNALKISPLRHLVNSPGVIRFPELHFDMVRLGIGLYGVEANNYLQNQLEPISSLKTIVSQINHLKAGQTVGYSRKGKVERDTMVATIAIGYADGFTRAFSNGVGHVFINGKSAPVIGNVCMDMSMIDVTDVPDVKEGDEVEIFGKNITISEVAQFINTIPYEILTSISQRVKRVYYTE